MVDAIETGFSPSLAEAADVTNRVQWKAKAFRYIDCINCIMQPLTLMTLEVTYKVRPL